MSEKKKDTTDVAGDSPEKTLLTLDQLSQTIDVMSSVVNRLRSHLSEQLNVARSEQQTKTQPVEHTANTTQEKDSAQDQGPRFIVEIHSDKEAESLPLDSPKILH